MRVMIIAKEGANPEPESPPDSKSLAEFGKYNEELVKSGVLLDAGRLHPSATGRRVRFAGSTRTVIDGPFTETKELVAGFWLWQVKSMDEAIEWLKRAPFDGHEFELRQVYETEEFAPVDATETRQ